MLNSRSICWVISFDNQNYLYLFILICLLRYYKTHAQTRISSDVICLCLWSKEARPLSMCPRSDTREVRPPGSIRFGFCLFLYRIKLSLLFGVVYHIFLLLFVSNCLWRVCGAVLFMTYPCCLRRISGSVLFMTYLCFCFVYDVSLFLFCLWCFCFVYDLSVVSAWSHLFIRYVCLCLF